MDDLLQIKRTEIIAGMNKEYVFFQISDIHMAVVDTESSQLDISDNIRFHKQWDSLKYKFADDAKEFCDERYDIEANELFEKLAEYALEINSDALILSGDIMDRVTESNLRYLKQFIKQ